MTHRLEVEYGLSAQEILDALEKRFRARVTLEGAVAEVHMERQIRALVASGEIERYERHDLDSYPDFTMWLPGRPEPLRAECKNVRNTVEAYRAKGSITAYKVETQKTRTSNADRSSRFYAVNQFDLIGVCLGKKTRNWAEFMFARIDDLQAHGIYPGKLAAMQRVPLPDSPDISPWTRSLGDLLLRFRRAF